MAPRSRVAPGGAGDARAPGRRTAAVAPCSSQHVDRQAASGPDRLPGLSCRYSIPGWQPNPATPQGPARRPAGTRSATVLSERWAFVSPIGSISVWAAVPASIDEGGDPVGDRGIVLHRIWRRIAVGKPVNQTRLQQYPNESGRHASVTMNETFLYGSGGATQSQPSESRASRRRRRRRRQRQRRALWVGGAIVLTIAIIAPLLIPIDHRVPSNHRPSVLFIGDSLTYQSSSALKADLGAKGFSTRVQAVSGSGLLDTQLSWTERARHLIRSRRSG